MSNIKKMSNKQAKEYIQSVIDSYDCLLPESPDVEQRVYRKIWVSAKDIEAMWMAIDLLEKEIANEQL